MPNTFSQIYIQIVFGVQGRQSLINPEWENNLYRYITGIVQNKEQKMLSINGMPDHIHFFIGMRPTCCIYDLVREVKKSSNEYIKDNRFSKYKFNWQEGFGAFSYSHSHLDRVIKYINNQKTHHKKKHLKMNMLNYWKNLKLRMIINIYLNGLNNSFITKSPIIQFDTYGIGYSFNLFLSMFNSYGIKSYKIYLENNIRSKIYLMLLTP